GDPAVNALWKDNVIPDDQQPPPQSNKRGFVSFATKGPNTRTTQLFINFVDNSRLDAMGFTPFGVIISGMDVVDAIHADYGEGAPRGRGPDQGRIQSEGNEYLVREFGELDFVREAHVE